MIDLNVLPSSCCSAGSDSLRSTSSSTRSCKKQTSPGPQSPSLYRCFNSPFCVAIFHRSILLLFLPLRFSTPNFVVSPTAAFNKISSLSLPDLDTSFARLHSHSTSSSAASSYQSRESRLSPKGATCCDQPPPSALPRTFSRDHGDVGHPSELFRCSPSRHQRHSTSVAIFRPS